ncbi:RDD family protein [Algoriphagus namhaensis]
MIPTRLLHFLVDAFAFFLFSLLAITIGSRYFDIRMIKVFLIICYFLAYFLFEFFFGQTLGKMLTKSEVVDAKTSLKSNFSQILIRTLVRLFPLYFITIPLTGLGLHDHISNTNLIKRTNEKTK